MRIELPTMRCDDGCGRCCGPVPCIPSEYDLATNYAAEHGIVPKRQGLTCPWFQDGICQVHEARPLICRLYGHVPRMTCPLGYNANISAAEEAKILRVYGPMLHRQRRYLHEVLGEDWREQIEETKACQE